MGEKRKIKFTLLDLIIIVFILACIAGIVIKSGVIHGFTEDEEMKTTVFTVKVEISNDYAANQAFKKDTLVKDAVSGVELGTITEISILPAYAEKDAGDGMLLKYEKENAKMMYLTIAGKALADEYGYYVGGSTVVCPGAIVEMESLFGLATGTVVEVHLAEEN